MITVSANITCPVCGYVTAENLPADRCVYFYKCRGCGVLLKPKVGDCCVFCSYADRRCPFSA